MQTIKYLFLKLITFVKSKSPIGFPWWALIPYVAIISYCWIMSIRILIKLYS